MSWKIFLRPEIEQEISDAAQWYNSREDRLGSEFVESVIGVWDSLMLNPFIGSVRHRKKEIRWRYTERFPYRVIYSIDENEKTIVVIAILHAARHERHWRDRI